MKNPNRLTAAMTCVMLLLALPYLLVKTGAWAPAASDAADSVGALPVRDPDDLPVIRRLDDFSLTNQLNETVRRADLQGQVWVADVIFTRCPGPCAAMTARMADLQASIPEAWPVKFVSLTADADYDTPEVLRGYAERFEADPLRWSFLHGAKPALVDLAVENLKLVVLDKEQERQSPYDLFIHSTTFALVDKHGRLRGAFESTPMVPPDELSQAEIRPAPADYWRATLKPRLLKAIERLLAER